MVIKVYIASSTGSVAVKKHQQAVVGFLEANRVSFQEVDITMLEEQRLWMYRNIPRDKQPEKGNPLLPQIFNEEHYCGDYEDFFQSKEHNTVFAFLGLSPQPSVKKDEARQEKSRNKDSANNKKSVWTMDFEAVLMCPKTQASCLYYKTKLQVHNFTLFDLKTKEG
ncbi:SH3 domain-binding glutamic acid-rich-like protein 2 [Cottoperca gobio]|uniref:SH3 domain-binding glutamic acid-rich-like protein 2 n=1 Tax=Cottoperca gobio TaxID=56716 RepID=A0A6J2P899_COTGO|nr:SH3 domain-binding glutamic acid-rich-like protein 2 [Cottoperca gobio]